jgi:O-antigen ligase
MLSPTYERGRFPLLLGVVVVGTVASWAAGSISILGFHLTGWAWVLAFLTAVVVVLPHARQMRFPLWAWLPWVIVVLVGWGVSAYPSTQRTIQLLCPLAVGWAMSTMTIDAAQLRNLDRVFKGIAFAFFAIAVYQGLSGEGSGFAGPLAFAPQSMTVALLCCYFVAQYARRGRAFDLVVWAMLMLIPIMALARMGIGAVALTLPLTLAPLAMRFRVAGALGVALMSWLVFNSERFQAKMFYSGQGGLIDVLEGDYSTSGREAMWEVFLEDIWQNPWFGRGTGAGEDLSWEITSGRSGYPHNDWLLLTYDHGLIGATLFGLAILVAAVHAYWVAHKAKSPECRYLMYAGASAFIPYVMFMYSDNITIYASYFGNLHFALLGLGYALCVPQRAAPRFYSARTMRHPAARWVGGD